MKSKQKRQLGTILVAGGLVLTLAGGVYELSQYPLRYLLGLETVEPQDPAPVTSNWIIESVPQQEELAELPGQEPEEPPSDEQEDEPLITHDGLLQVGVIKIPVVDRAENILEGVDRAPMRVGVGHMPGTALPGQPGNCVLAGHRTHALLRHLEIVSPGDTVILEDQKNKYTYEVYDNFVVEPTELWITEPDGTRASIVTLFTCTPYMVSTHRMVVRGELVSTEPLDSTS